MIQTDAAIKSGQQRWSAAGFARQRDRDQHAIYGQQGRIGIGFAMPITAPSRCSRNSSSTAPFHALAWAYDRVRGRDLAGMLELPSQGGLLIQTVGVDRPPKPRVCAALRGWSLWAVSNWHRWGLDPGGGWTKLEDNNTLPTLLNRKRAGHDRVDDLPEWPDPEVAGQVG